MDHGYGGIVSVRLLYNWNRYGRVFQDTHKKEWLITALCTKSELYGIEIDGCPRFLLLVRFAFGLFLWLVAASMFLPKAQPRPHDHVASWQYNTGLMTVGILMGMVSALFGVGGGALLVPALVVLFGISIHHAIATSTAIIGLTAVFGTANYLLIGWHDPATPALALGWIHPVAWLLLMPGALFATRAGIRTAMGLSRERLRTVLVLFQIGVGARFIFG